MPKTMLRLHPEEHTLLEFVGKLEHNHKNDKSKWCMPHGDKKKGLSQCGEAQKGLEESEKKEVLVMKTVSLKAEIFNSFFNRQTKLNVTFLITILVNE